MARIFYGVAGEGRGHAARARAVIESLRDQHTLTVYAADQAHSMLAPLYEGTEVRIREVPGLGFRYVDGQKLSYVRSFGAAVPFLAQLPGRVAEMRRLLEREGADLVVSDFEPILPRAAKQAGIPYASLDHQQFLVACDLSALPQDLNRYAAFMRPFVQGFCHGQDETIVSSFFHPPLRPSHAHVRQVGVLLRPEVLRARAEIGDHVVAYVRRESARGVLRSLSRVHGEVHVYGLGKQLSSGNVKFLPIDPLRFVEDLASCRALVTTAGNQLVGEALYLRKPVLAVPEPGNQEQRINGWFLSRSGAGVSIDLPWLTATAVHRFLDRAEVLRARIDPDSVQGNAQTIAILRRMLRGTPLPPPRRALSPALGART